MADYRRYRVNGATCFFTVVTAGRAPVFSSPEAVELLRQAIDSTRQARPFRIRAAVVLPDHLHALWTLPVGDTDYSTRWAAIKAAFTQAYLARGGREQAVSGASRREGRRGVWQRRFFEHTIRDPDDFSAHVRYIHRNPVKHGLVGHPSDWPHSSIHAWIRRGWLPASWTCTAEEAEPRWMRTPPQTGNVRPGRGLDPIASSGLCQGKP